MSRSLNQNDYKRIIILPFNGAGNIKKLFDLLSLPLSDESERTSIKGKIVLLIDTDEKNPIRIEGYKPSRYDNKLLFYRLSLDRHKDSCQLISAADVNATNTVIEDTLHPIALWDTLTEISQDDDQLRELLHLYESNPDAAHADITRSQAFLSPKEKEGYERKPEIMRLLSGQSLKQRISKTYPKHSKNHPTPQWAISLAEKVIL